MIEQRSKGNKGGSEYIVRWQYNDAENSMIEERGLYRTKIEYNGWSEKIRETDGEANSVNYTYNKTGELIHIADALGA